MFSLRMTASLALALNLAAVSTGAAAQQICWKPREIEAAKVRDLQTFLMVGALQCSESSGLLRAYNRFVSDNREVLAAHNAVLKAHFAREDGMRGGQASYDRFTTRLANTQSGDSQDSPQSYCRTVEMIMDMAADARAEELDIVANELGERPNGVGAACEIDRDSLPRARTASYEDEAEDAPAVMAASAPAPAPVAKPVEVAMAAPASAESDEAALKAATLAVQSAVAALQAAVEAQAKAHPKAVAVQASAPVREAAAEPVKGIHPIADAPIVPPPADDAK